MRREHEMFLLPRQFLEVSAHEVSSDRSDLNLFGFSAFHPPRPFGFSVFRLSGFSGMVVETGAPV